MNAQTLQAAQAIDAALQATIAAALPRPKPAHLAFQDAWLMNESRRQSPQWLLDQARDLMSQLHRFLGAHSDPQPGCMFIDVPFNSEYIRVEYEIDDGAAEELAEVAEVMLLGVFVNGSWCDPENFTEELRTEWVEFIDAHLAEQNARNKAEA